MDTVHASERQPPSLAEIRSFRRRLLGWFARNQRDLPWRRTDDPYAIWISEVTLQQTRVETAIPYYERFLRRFPTLAHLANASWEEVAGCWAGLGYYARARNLHRAAREIVAHHGGGIPDAYPALIRLPGIGPYIAGAILSIAYDRPVPALDGNARRVLSRYFALPGDLRRPPLDRDLFRRAAALVPASGAGQFNQALMELGATVCTPRRPNCRACPVAERCRALAAGQAEAFPQAVPRPEVRELQATIAAVFKNGRILLSRRPPEGLWGGLWEIPQFEAPQALGPLPLASRLRERFGIEVEVGPRVGRVRHLLSHRRILGSVRTCTWLAGSLRPNGQARARWVLPTQVERYPVSAFCRKILAVLRRDGDGRGTP